MDLMVRVKHVCLEPMISLQHLAVLKLSETQKYEGNEPIIENVIFEADQIRNQLEDELCLHFGKKPKRVSRKIDMKGYNAIVGSISTELFDVFTYPDMIRTPEHVQWKEYFHTLYEFIVVDGEESDYLVLDTIKHHNEIEPPQPLEHNDPCYPTVTYINNLFKSLKAEQERMASHVCIKKDVEEGVDYGMRMLGWTQEWTAIHDRLSVYNRILDWSMR